MKRIAEVRRGLATIPESTIDFPPEPVYPGYEPGVHAINTIWSGEDGPPGESQLVPADRPDDTETDQSEGISEFEPVFEIGADLDETFPALNGSEGQAIHQNVLHHGIDALGAYLSFHVTGRQWGIYLPVSGLAYLVGRVFAPLRAPLEVKCHLAFHAILSHELFHFAADCVIAQAELVHGEPWWVPALNARLNGDPKYLVREEKLANAYMLRAFRTARPTLRVAGKQRALRDFTLQQPRGYKEAATVRPQDWDRELARLADEYGRHSQKGASNSRLWNPALGYDWPGQFAIRPKIDWRYCPIHIIDDGARLRHPSRLDHILRPLGATARAP